MREGRLSKDWSVAVDGGGGFRRAEVMGFAALNPSYADSCRVDSSVVRHQRPLYVLRHLDQLCDLLGILAEEWAHLL